jgi:hypothetical protein
MPVAIIWWSTNGVPSASPSDAVTLGARNTWAPSATHERRMCRDVVEEVLSDRTADRALGLLVSLWCGRAPAAS